MNFLQVCFFIFPLNLFFLNIATKSVKTTKYGFLKSRVNSALSQFKDKKIPSEAPQRSPLSTKKAKLNTICNSKSYKRFSAKNEPYTATAKVSKDMMLNEMSKQIKGKRINR